MRGRERKWKHAARPDVREPGGLLPEVAAAARLAEGPEGVRRMLRALFRRGTMPIRDLAREVALPVPVVAAVRGELEKRKLLVRGKGLALSEAGLSAVRKDTGLSCRRQFPPPLYPAIPADLEGALGRMREICERRPEVDVTLDQSHATPETALRRALYLFEHDALEGRDILILGDDDLTSVALGLLSASLCFRIRRTVVLEVDPRLAAYLEEVAGENGCSLEVIRHDLRRPLPEGLAGRFDVFLTDPPYTPKGLDLFVSRGTEGLRPEVGKQGYICFGHRMPDEMAEAIGALAGMGLAPVEILPGFNRYVGAQVLAGVSQMIRTVSTSRLRPGIEGPYSGPLYTADRKRSRRSYGR